MWLPLQNCSTDYLLTLEMTGVLSFFQISEFWRQLDWPDLVDAFPMVLKLTKVSLLHLAIIPYAELFFPHYTP